MLLRQILEHITDNPEEAYRRLMERYGSMQKALYAEYEDLVEVLPEEKTGTVYLRLLRELARYVSVEPFGQTPVLHTASRVRQYLEACYIGAKCEKCLLLCLDEKFRLIHCVDMSKGSAMEVSVYMRRIAEEALRSESSYVVMSHNHPSGKQLFSLEDLQATHAAAEAMRSIGVRLLDHVLVTRWGSVSLRKEGVFQTIWDGTGEAWEKNYLS